MFGSFKRILAGGLTLAMVAGIMASGGAAQAQERTRTNVPGGWGSAILIQNVGTTTLAPDQYTIDFYNASGDRTQFTPPADASIAPGASREFYIPTTSIPGLDAGQYSGVVSSSVPVKAVVNSSTDRAASAPWSAFAYEGVDATATSTRLFFPGFYKQYFGFNSELVIQNTGTGTANVQATFYSSSTGQQYGPFSLPDILPGVALTMSSSDSIVSSLPSGPSGLFGVVIESTNSVPLAGISNIWTVSDADAGAGSFNAFTSGADSVYAGALYNQYFGFVASITVQNLNSSAAAGEIVFSDGTRQPFNIPANQAREYFLPGIAGLGSGNTNGLLSATISSPGGNIVALVNIQRKQRGSTSIADPENPAFGSYGATPTAATSVRVPAIFNDYFGYFTAVTVQNAGTQAAVITLTYGDGRTWSTPTAIEPGRTFNFSHLPGAPGNPLGFRTQIGGTVSSSQPLVVVVQHNTGRELTSFNPRFLPNDFLFALTGFPE